MIKNVMKKNKLQLLILALFLSVVFSFGLIKPANAATTIFSETFESCNGSFVSGDGFSCTSGLWQSANWGTIGADGWANIQSYPSLAHNGIYYAVSNPITYANNYQGGALFSPTYNYDSSTTYNVNFYTGVAGGGSCKLEIGAVDKYQTMPNGIGYITLSPAETISNNVATASNYALKQKSSLTIPTGKKYIVFVVYGCTSEITNLLLDDVTIISNSTVVATPTTPPGATATPPSGATPTTPPGATATPPVSTGFRANRLVCSADGMAWVEQNYCAPASECNMYSISGNIYLDSNENGVKDSGESLYTAGNVSITIADSFGDTKTITSSSGIYSTNVAAGTYRITFSGLSEGSFTYPESTTFPPNSFNNVVIGSGCNIPIPPEKGADCSSGNAVNLNAGITNMSKPWFQSVGADMRWDSGFTNPLPSSLTFASIAGLESQMPGIIFSGETDPNFGERGGKANISNWQVGNGSYREVFTDTHNLVPTSYRFLMATINSSKKENTIKTITNIDISNMSTSGIYKIGSTTINTPIIFGAGNFIILVDGNLTINGNITVPSGSTAIFSATGNINIGSNVTRIEGLYSADGTVTVGGTACPNSDDQLNVAGTIVANAGRTGGTFVNERDLCASNISTPSIVFTERPDFMINYPSIARQSTRAWQEVSP
jgi:hypothetical protein